MLRTIATTSSLKYLSETFWVSNEEAKNMNSRATKITRAKLTKGKTSKNFTKFKIAKVMLSETAIKAKLFSIPGAKRTFTKLRYIFTKILILDHFDLEYYIHIETYTSKNTKSEVFN